jgi:hypothetical protein
MTCFLEGSEILCFEAGEELWIPVETIRSGTLVKTESHGCLPVHAIGFSKIENPSHNKRIRERLYRLSPDAYAELSKDLILTGDHSILVDNLTQAQADAIAEEDQYGRIYTTEKKYRLMAFLDDRAQIWEESGNFIIWHLALEHTMYLNNYGIYANGGLLVESTSIRSLKELSRMTLVN